MRSHRDVKRCPNEKKWVEIRCSASGSNLLSKIEHHPVEQWSIQWYCGKKRDKKTTFSYIIYILGRIPSANQYCVAVHGTVLIYVGPRAKSPLSLKLQAWYRFWKLLCRNSSYGTKKIPHLQHPSNNTGRARVGRVSFWDEPCCFAACLEPPLWLDSHWWADFQSFHFGKAELGLLPVPLLLLAKIG